MAKISTLFRFENRWQPASTLQLIHSEPKYPPLYLPVFNKLFSKGLSRGTIVEAHGPRSSARTSACIHMLAQATTRGEVCAVIDLYDSFDPASAHAAGVQLDHILWVHCRSNAEHAIRAADLLLHAGGFGIVLLDLCEANPHILNRIPLSYWYRFRRAIEHTPAILLICTDSPQAKSCSAYRLQLKPKAFSWAGIGPFLLLRGIKVSATLRRHAAFRTIGSPPACVLESVL